MCSEREWREREQFRELSRLEYAEGATDHDKRPRCDPALAVRRFKRPEAGAPPPPSSELRPLPALQSTAAYLLRLWHSRPGVSIIDRYHFISDRFRAMMQDLAVQRISSPELLCSIARFHALMDLAFCQTSTADGFSQVQNREMLCNALISALQLGAAPPPTALHAELLGYFLLLHADQPETFTCELLRAPAAVRQSELVLRVLRLAAAFANGDAPLFWRCVRALPPLAACCTLQLLPAMRDATLRAHDAALKAPQPASARLVPVRTMAARLGLRDEQAAARLLEWHGVRLEPAAAAGGAPVAHFRAPNATFVASPPAIEPPLPPPAVPSLERLAAALARHAAQPAPAAAAPADAAPVPAGSGTPPPPTADVRVAQAAQAAQALAKVDIGGSEAAPAPATPARGGKDWLFLLLADDVGATGICSPPAWPSLD